MGFFADTFGAIFGGNKDKEPEGSVGTVYQGAGGPGGMTGGEAFQSGIITPEERREQLLKEAAAAQESGQSYSLNTDEFTGDNLGLSNEETKGKLREGMTGPEYATFMQTLYGNNPGAMQQAFPFSSGAAVGNIMKPLVGLASGGAGGIMNLLPNILSSVNQGLGGIFNKEKAPTDMGTSMSSMDQADLDALKGPGMADISGESTGDGTFKTAEEAIAASGYPAAEFAPSDYFQLGVTNPNLINANSLLNFNDLLNFNSDSVDAQSIANAYKALTDNQGFDVQDNQLQYNQPLFGGNLQFGVGPGNVGINFTKGFNT
jgi:hypothetical protein